MQIEAIIFDIGGVLWRRDGPPLSEKWAVRCSLDAKTFDKIVYGSEWGGQALAGAISHEELFANIGALLNLPVSELAELEQDFWYGKWNQPLLDYIATLKPKYKLGIISDAYTGAREAVRDWVNEDLFEVIVFSAEEYVCKPDPEIFRRALARLGVEAEATVFIDDQPYIIEGVKQLGIHAIQYKGLAQLQEELKRYL